MLEVIRILLAYNAWANGRVRAAARTVDDVGFSTDVPGLSHGSLHGALVHVYAAEQVWMSRVNRGTSPRHLPNSADLPTLTDLERAWDVQTTEIADLATSLSEARLTSPVRYTTTGATGHETPLWQILLHLVNHGTQFRAEASVALTALGASPGDLDLIAYIRD